MAAASEGLASALRREGGWWEEPGGMCQVPATLRGQDEGDEHTGEGRGQGVFRKGRLRLTGGGSRQLVRNIQGRG